MIRFRVVAEIGYGREMHDDLERLDTEIGAALMGLSAEQTQAGLAAQPEKWSIQQIVEHLCQTYGASTPAVQTRIDKGAPTRAVPSLQQYVGQFVLISLGRFPSGREAPPAVMPPMPSVPASGAELQARVGAELKRLDDVTREGERVFGRARAASHLVLGPLSMKQWRRFHLIHGRHHLKQIWKIRKEHAF